MKKKVKVRKFVQIAAAPLTYSHTHYTSGEAQYSVPNLGVALYALDDQGQVWSKMPYGRGTETPTNWEQVKESGGDK